MENNNPLSKTTNKSTETSATPQTMLLLCYVKKNYVWNVKNGRSIDNKLQFAIKLSRFQISNMYGERYRNRQTYEFMSVVGVVKINFIEDFIDWDESLTIRVGRLFNWRAEATWLQSVFFSACYRMTVIIFIASINFLSLNHSSSTRFSTFSRTSNF